MLIKVNINACIYQDIFNWNHYYTHTIPIIIYWDIGILNYYNIVI